MPRDPLLTVFATALIQPTPAVIVRPTLRARLLTSLAGWNAQRRERHAQRLRVRALAALGDYVMRDVGISDELRLQALAQRESRLDLQALSSWPGR